MRGKVISRAGQAQQTDLPGDDNGAECIGNGCSRGHDREAHDRCRDSRDTPELRGTEREHVRDQRDPHDRHPEAEPDPRIGLKALRGAVGDGEAQQKVDGKAEDKPQTVKGSVGEVKEIVPIAPLVTLLCAIALPIGASPLAVARRCAVYVSGGTSESVRACTWGNK